MLIFRLKELYNKVDYFVLVESTKTFSNKDKILYFDINKRIFNKYLDKIIHIIVDDNPISLNAWDNEIFQRNCIMRGLDKIPNLKENDIIILTDCDEIISTSVLDKINNMEIVINKPYRLYMDLYIYNLTTKGPNKWTLPIILPYLYLLKNTLHEYRLNLSHTNIIDKAGWHFTYFGDEQFIMNKITSFSHQELNIPCLNNKENIISCIKNKKCWFQDENYIHSDIKSNNFLPINYRLLL